jgi:hypothetical protein
MKYIIVFVIWLIGCFIADYVFKMESRAYNMLWGFVVGTFAVLCTKLYA